MSKQHSGGDVDSESGSVVRIYGLTTESGSRRGEGGDSVFAYCGFRAGGTELRLPSARVWYLREADIVETGKVEGFTVEGEQVQFYDVELGTPIREQRFESVSLETEVFLQGVFAGAVAEPPPDDLPTADDMRSFAQALARTGGVGGPGGVGGLGLAWGGSKSTGNPCHRYVQTYRSTAYPDRSMSDPAGADCRAEDYE